MAPQRCGCSPPSQFGLLGWWGRRRTAHHRALGEGRQPTRLTSDIIIGPLGALGIAEINKALSKGPGIRPRRRSPGRARLAGEVDPALTA